jgi:hypothetical protein
MESEGDENSFNGGWCSKYYYKRQIKKNEFTEKILKIAEDHQKH